MMMMICPCDRWTETLHSDSAHAAPKYKVTEFAWDFLSTSMYTICCIETDMEIMPQLPFWAIAANTGCGAWALPRGSPDARGWPK